MRYIICTCLWVALVAGNIFAEPNQLLGFPEEEFSLTSPLQAPQLLDIPLEGTEIVFDDTGIEDLLAMNRSLHEQIKVLVREISQTHNPSSQVREDLRKRFKEMVEGNTPNGHLMLLRYALNRALVLDDLYGESVSPQVAILQILRPSLQMAVTLSKVDEEYILKHAREGLKPPNFSGFAKGYFPFLLGVALFAPSLQVEWDMLKYALGWTRWNLNYSLDRRNHWEVIKKIYEWQQKMVEWETRGEVTVENAHSIGVACHEIYNQMVVSNPINF